MKKKTKAISEIASNFSYREKATFQRTIFCPFYSNNKSFNESLMLIFFSFNFPREFVLNMCVCACINIYLKYIIFKWKKEGWDITQ